jgi:hypothetical protein
MKLLPLFIHLNGPGTGLLLTSFDSQSHLLWLSMVDINEQKKLLPSASQDVSLPGNHPTVKNRDLTLTQVAQEDFGHQWELRNIPVLCYPTP